MVTSSDYTGFPEPCEQHVDELQGEIGYVLSSWLPLSMNVVARITGAVQLKINLVYAKEVFQMLEVWGRKTSSNVQALMWCIGELELPYQRYDVGHKYGGTDSDEFYLLNPNRTIPVIRDNGGLPFWETGAILRYLACRYGHETFWPKDVLERTSVDRWTEWAKISVAMNFNEPIFWRVVHTPAHLRDSTAIKKAVESFEKRLMIAETQLTQYQYLAGNDFTLADIQFGHVLFRYFDIDISRAKLPQLRKYYEGLRQRSPYREHVMVSYEELRV